MNKGLFNLTKQEDFLKLFTQKQKVVITTHTKPDADALGSSLALKSVLKKMGHSVDVIVPSEYPSFLNWMDKDNQVINFLTDTKKVSLKKLSDATIIFCLDYSVFSRVNSMGRYLSKTKAIKVMIDHHENPDDFADFQLWSTEAAATCELLYVMFRDIGWEKYIDNEVANCLYAGVLTDTGSFKHANTTQHVHEVVAKLIALGADLTLVNRLIYDNYGVLRFKLLGFMLLERLVLINDMNTAYFYLTLEDQTRFNVQVGDTEGIVNYALRIKGTKLATIFIEEQNYIKISFRSVGNMPVNDFSEQFFSGGGHKNASGGRSDLSLEETRKKFEDKLKYFESYLI